MHQPVYEIEGTYLMPWSRLHAVKDYLDMALFLDRFPKLKQQVIMEHHLVLSLVMNGVNAIE